MPMNLQHSRSLCPAFLLFALAAFLPLRSLHAQVPVITSPSTALATISGGNPSFIYTIAATNSPTGFTASPLPPGVALAGGSTLSGSPTTPGVYTIALTASNTHGTGTGTLTLTVGVPQTFASGFNYPTTLKFDSSGNLYTPNQNSTTISEISPNGVVSTFASNLSNPDTLVFNAPGALYVGNLGNNIIDQVGPPPTNQLTALGSGFNAPSGIAFDSAGNLYVANANAGTVSKVTPGGVVSNWVTGLSSPTDVIFDAAGNLYICDHGTDALYRVGPSGGSPATLLTGLSNPLRMAVDAGGNVYVSLYGTGAIMMVAPSGAAATFATLDPGVCGLAFDSTGNLYVSNINENTITRIGAAPGTDPTPPSIRSLTPSPASIWPPNKKMVPVTLSISGANLDRYVVFTIISVTTNEPNGDTQWQITGPLTLNLLADRQGTGTGRIYTITVQARDAAGNASTKTCIVTVPHDQGK